MPVQRGRRAVVGLILWAGITFLGPSSQISRSALLLSDVEGNQSGEEGGQIGPIRAYQRKRRLKFLEDQPSKASRLHDHAIRLAPQPPESNTQSQSQLEIEMGSQASDAASLNTPTPPDDKAQTLRRSSSGINGIVRRVGGGIRAKWRSIRAEQELMIPEWLVDAPPNLSQEWYVTARPEGVRCLVLSGGGQTLAFTEHNKEVVSFQSSLPGGRANNPLEESNHGSSVCDCVRYVDQGGNTILYVIDVMAWCGYQLYNTEFEFRRFWISQKILPDGAPEAPEMTRGEVPVRMLCWGKASASEIWVRYSTAMRYEKDGLLFAHSKCAYLPGQPSPLLLRWKDSRCSRYPIDTLKNGTAIPTQRALLKVLQDGVSLGTSDIPPVVVGILKDRLIHQNYSGHLVQAEIGPRGVWVNDCKESNVGGLRRVTWGEDSSVGADLEGMRILPAYRQPFTFSRLLFQYLSRTSPVTIGMVMGASRRDTRTLPAFISSTLCQNDQSLDEEGTIPYTSPTPMSPLSGRKDNFKHFDPGGGEPGHESGHESGHVPRSGSPRVMDVDSLAD
ncbi:hypothetical protein AAMO2058_000223300 [Amorphochlora amoebiformis]